MYILVSVLQIPDQEQASNREISHLLSSTNWDQKLITFYAFVQSIGSRMTMIGYRISEATYKMKPSDYYIAGSP